MKIMNAARESSFPRDLRLRLWTLKWRRWTLSLRYRSRSITFLVSALKPLFQLKSSIGQNRSVAKSGLIHSFIHSFSSDSYIAPLSCSGFEEAL